MSKILAVFGSTGHQGGSVINHVLNDPELSQEYSIRAITRNVNSDKAKHLKDKVQVVQGDVLDRASLETALSGVHTVFAMTVPSFGPDGFEIEYNSAKMIADVAVEKGAKYIIFATLPSVTNLSGGKYTRVTQFDAKAEAEQYIRGLDIKSAFVSMGSYMDNWENPHMAFLAPKKTFNDTWVLALPDSPETRLPLVDAHGDTGKFVGAILAEPDKYQGTTCCAATALYSLEEITATMSKATGKNVTYEQVPLDDWKKTLPFAPELFAEVFLYPEEFGYYGSDSEELVAWANEHARGRLSTFENYLKAHPLQLG